MQGTPNTAAMRILRLVGKDSSARRKRIQRADIVISEKGYVVKDRHGRSGRKATVKELKLAVDG